MRCQKKKKKMEKERKTSVCSVSDSLDAIAWGICEENCKMLVWVILTVYLYETCMKRGGKGGKKKKKEKAQKPWNSSCGMEWAAC